MSSTEDARSAALSLVSYAALQGRSRRVEVYGPAREWLFGSLAERTAHEHRDVDLAVDGLTGAAYFQALADLMVACGGAVDLVILEEASAATSPPTASPRALR